MKSNPLTILAAGTFLRGDLFSQDTLVVEGGVQGNVAGDRVIVKASGWVKGSLTCRSLSIELGGIVEGQVQVTSQDALPRPAEAERTSLEQNTNTLVLGDASDKSLEQGTDTLVLGDTSDNSLEQGTDTMVLGDTSDNSLKEA